MKMKILLLTLFVVFIVASCYQGVGNDAINGGSLAFRINAPMRSHGLEAGDAGELRIKFFEASEMDYKIDRYPFPDDNNYIGGYISYDDAISYLSKPTPITINGKKTTISYFQTNTPLNGLPTAPNDGIIEIDRVPAGVSLRAVVEYYDYNAGYNYTYVWNEATQSDDLELLFTNYTTHAGVSEPFTVKKDSSTTVTIKLERAAFATVKFNVPSYVIYVPITINVMTPEAFDSNYEINGKIINRNGSTPTPYGFNSATQQIDVLPGKKLKLLLRDKNSSGSPAGLSQTFELAPGEIRQINVDWSYIANFQSA